MTQEEYAKIERLIEPLGVPYDVKFLFQADLFRPAQAQLSTGVLTDLKEYVDFVAVFRAPTRTVICKPSSRRSCSVMKPRRCR